MVTPRRPKRRDILLVVRDAEALLRQLGSNWQELPGYLRLPMLSLANRLARVLERSKIKRR